MTTRQLTALFLLVACAVLSPGPAAAQLAGETDSGIVEEDLGEDIEGLLAEAEEVFHSADQPDSILLYDRIILQLERLQGEGTLDEEGGAWLKLGLFRRAEARSNLLERQEATADLTAIIRLDPAWQMPEGHMVSRLLSDLLGSVRDAETGVLDPLIAPPDAEVLLDGEPLGPLSGPRRVLAGERQLLVRRPGYTEIEQPLTIPPAGSVPIELTLERASAVIRLTTRPAGVEVVRGGQVLAVSESVEEGDDEQAAELVVEGLETGLQRLTLRKPGYRPAEVEVEIGELTDYLLAPVSLEPTRGTVAIAGVPAAARVLVDGQPSTGAAGQPGDLRLELPPGSHELRVEAGSAGLFERRFELEDRQLVEIEVRLRPGLVLLGVLGGDRVAAADLEIRLAEGLGSLAEWALVQRAERGFELLREAGIDRQLMRSLAAETGAPDPPDWTALQEALDKGLGGSAYLLAVLSDDLYASRADLWLWSAAPGPIRPARRRIQLAEDGGIDELAGALDQPLRLSSPWVGARFVDSPAVQFPLVLSVEAQGPAAAAGLRPGDTVRSIDGQEVTGVRQLNEQIAGLAAGREVALAVGGEGEGRNLLLTPGVSPVVVSLNDVSGLDPALAARLASLELSIDAETPAWLVRLNRGVVLMRSGEWRRAAEALRGIKAPASAGLGQATVDYLLGVTLFEVDRAAYRDTAQGLIGRAAEGRARLEHNDGPLLAPRARARLETLLGQE